MSNLGALGKFITYLLETYPHLEEESISAEHDSLYLPYPVGVSLEVLEEKAKECGLFISEEFDSIKIFA